MADGLTVTATAATGSVEAVDLKTENGYLRQMLQVALQEKDRLLRLLRQHNLDLQSRVQDQTQQLLSLNRLVTTINASLDLQEVAITALSGLQTLVDVQAASLALVGGDGEIKFVMGYPTELMPVLSKFKLKVGQGIVGQVIQTGQAHLANDVRQDPAFLPGVDLATGFTTRSILCEPLIVRERIIGALELINKWSGPFDDADQAFVETMAGSLAIAVDNARMYEEAQARLKEVVRINAQLVETQNQLVQSEKLASIGQLTAGLAHEINNPLGILYGYAQLLDERAAGNAPITEYAATIVRQALRIKRIVNDLLGFARHDKPEVVRVDLRQLVDTVLDLVEYQLAAQKIQVNRIYDLKPSCVMVDGEQILQVLMNLIQNASQAMPQGGILTLRTWSEDRYSLFSVSDQGIGIPEANLDRVFDPFFTTKPVGQGTGLGLSVSYGIIARHGGDVRVTSQPGVGSTFTVRLPAASESLPDGSHDPAAPGSADSIVPAGEGQTRDES
jgi:signal transduction histidine kinase